PPAGLDENGRARPGGQHHQAHDRGAAHGHPVAAHAHLRVEMVGHAHEAGRGAGVEPALVADGQPLADSAAGIGKGFAQTPRTSLATLMYLRPASAAILTASRTSVSPRTRASLTSMGRFMPAITSMARPSITDMARLLGVPPNMSVRITTPPPLSTASAAAMMSLRRASMSSSGSMEIALTPSWGPTTWVRAAQNSSASLPWATRTIPIIGRTLLSVPSGPAAQGRSLGPQRPRFKSFLYALLCH